MEVNEPGQSVQCLQFCAKSRQPPGECGAFSPGPLGVTYATKILIFPHCADGRGGGQGDTHSLQVEPPAKFQTHLVLNVDQQNLEATPHPLQVRAQRLALCPFSLSVSCFSVKELRRQAG